MDYLFLRRHRRTATSKRQKNLLLKAAERQWELQFANKGAEGRKVDCTLYKCPDNPHPPGRNRAFLST